MAFSLIEYLKRGPSTSKEIQAASGQSQSSVSRLVQKSGNQIVQISSGRTRTYAATQSAFNSSDSIPLTAIDENAENTLIARFRPLNCGGFFIEPETPDLSPLLLGEKMNGWYEDLPYFLWDLRPQGFLGRQIARKIAAQCDDFPPDPRYWTQDHIGRYLIANGNDLPGNLLFGEQAVLRPRQQPAAVTQKDYPLIAKGILEGEIPGSSTGGEQPKFTAYNHDLQSHVIVKFISEKGGEISKRWRDILITEYHAAGMVNEQIFPAAIPRFLEIDGWMFLETQRFDRVKKFGRKPLISLSAIDNEFAGLGSNWPKIMRHLNRNNLVTEKDVRHTEALWLFGLLINNTDMHPGNLSLSPDGPIFRLLPVYDMCSMGFAPKNSGIIPPFSVEAMLNNGAGRIFDASYFPESQESTIDAAHQFWEEVAGDDRISDDFRTFLRQGNPVDRLKV